jgi:hypothetical protein
MEALDEIIFNALRSDAELMTAVGGRIKSTCFEVGPDEPDNTPLPCIIVMDDGLQNNPDEKDCEWESWEDRVTASVEIDAESPKAVKQLIARVRSTVATVIEAMLSEGMEVPELDSLQSNGIAWDWMKPCYHSTLTYNCTIPNEQ